MSETDLWERLIEAERRAATAEAKLAAYEQMAQQIEDKKAKNRERMRLVRARSRTNVHNDAQTCTLPSPPPFPSPSLLSPTPPNNTTPPLSPLPTPVTLVHFDDFEACWLIYPKRSGSNPRRDALKAYRARRQAGVNPEDLLAGTQRYAAHCEAVEKTGTEFVMQGARFFGPSEPFREAWDLPTTGGMGRTKPNGRLSPSERIDATMAKATLKGQPAWMTAKIPC